VQIVNLEEQLEQFREELENKSEEVNQLNMQLEIQRKEISSHQLNQTRLTQVRHTHTSLTTPGWFNPIKTIVLYIIHTFLRPLHFQHVQN